MRPQSFFRALSIIHYSMFAVLAILALFFYLVNRSFEAHMDEGDIFIYIVPILSVAGYFSSQFFFRKQIQHLKEMEKLGTKLKKYRTASLIQYMLLEVPIFIALAAYYQSGNALHLVIVLALIAYFFAQRPTRQKFIKDVSLSNAEAQDLF